MNYKYFFNFTIDLFSFQRSSWSIKSIQDSHTVKSGKCNTHAEKSDTSLFYLDGRIKHGWYMLEVQFNLPSIKSRLKVTLNGDNVDSTVHNYPLALHSERISKRLIKIDNISQFQFAVPLNIKFTDIKHFRLVKVNQRFARSRLIVKLKALHPAYKPARNREYERAAQADVGKLWEDYCTVFEETSELISYPSWIRKFEALADEQRFFLRSHVKKNIQQPLLSIVMPVYNPNPIWLEEVIESVCSQLYSNWELCIADDVSTNPKVTEVLERLRHTNQRIKVVFRKNNGHISAASNSALRLAKGEWVVLLDHDDILPEYALLCIVEAINQHPEVKLIYSDEDKIDESGMRSDAYFKPDWNQDLFYSQNMFSHLGVYHTDLVRKVGGFREGFEGSQDYDLALRCIEHIRADQIHHIPRVLYHWRIHADSTAHSMDAKPYAMIAGERALNEHFARVGVDAQVESVGYGYRVRYALPAILPLVSLLIPTRNGLKLLKQCVHSILTKTDYANYEILIIDNGSDDSATLRYLKKLGDDARIRVIRDDGPFNYSALNNAAVKLAKGEIIGLINNDVEVINPDWLSEMVSHVLRPEVGAVGARLWYSDDTLQHAGVILGVHGIAGHAHRFLPRGNVGYCGRAALTQSFSAVTAACMLVRKAVYEEMGGLNEVELQVACNDVDFCLRLREAGYRNIWTPYAELYHHESASRGFDDTPEKQARSAKEVAYMQQRWGDALWTDPAYNPNLSLDNEDFTLAWPPRIDMASH